MEILGIKVFGLDEFQSEVIIHRWTGNWHWPENEMNCTDAVKYMAKPTEGAEKNIHTSKRCSGIHA